MDCTGMLRGLGLALLLIALYGVYRRVLPAPLTVGGRERGAAWGPAGWARLIDALTRFLTRVDTWIACVVVGTVLFVLPRWVC